MLTICSLCSKIHFVVSDKYSQIQNVRLAQLDRAFGYGPKGRGFESSNARHIKNGTGHKVLSHFLFESGRTRTGSIYISFRSLLNACHRHAAASNAQFSEKRLSNILLKKIPSGIVKMILPKRSEKYDRKNCYYENQLRIKRRYLLAL